MNQPPKEAERTSQQEKEERQRARALKERQEQSGCPPNRVGSKLGGQPANHGSRTYDRHAGPSIILGAESMLRSVLGLKELRLEENSHSDHRVRLIGIVSDSYQ